VNTSLLEIKFATGCKAHFSENRERDGLHIHLITVINNARVGVTAKV
jgi:hypothetical protein